MSKFNKEQALENSERIYMDSKSLKRVSLTRINKNLKNSESLSRDFIKGDICEIQSPSLVYNPSIFCEHNNNIMDNNSDNKSKVENIFDFISNTTIIKSDENK